MLLRAELSNLSACRSTRKLYSLRQLGLHVCLCRTAEFPWQGPKSSELTSRQSEDSVNNCLTCRGWQTVWLTVPASVTTSLVWPAGLQHHRQWQSPLSWHWPQWVGRLRHQARASPLLPRRQAQALYAIKFGGPHENGDPGSPFPGTPLANGNPYIFGFMDNDQAASDMQVHRRTSTVQWWHLHSVSWYSGGVSRATYSFEFDSDWQVIDCSQTGSIWHCWLRRKSRVLSTLKPVSPPFPPSSHTVRCSLKHLFIHVYWICGLPELCVGWLNANNAYTGSTLNINVWSRPESWLCPQCDWLGFSCIAMWPAWLMSCDYVSAGCY